MKFILGRKIEMSRIFTEEGESIPVTLIGAGPCKIIRKKEVKVDGYEAFQVGFEKNNKEKKSAKNTNFRCIKEFPVSKENQHNPGDSIDVSLFKKGEIVNISGISKGKGFQGGVKRWGFSGANASHGVKHNMRKIGSIGSAYPQRVIKGRKMPGRMGSDRITVKGLEIINIDTDKNIIIVKGAVPGKRGTLLEICTVL